MCFLFPGPEKDGLHNGRYAYQLYTIVAGTTGYPEATDDTTITPFYYYKGKLIELTLKDVTVTTVTDTDVTVEKRFDTMHVQLIDPIRGLYVQFDSFYSRAAVIKHGLYKDSPIGVKLGEVSLDERDTTATKGVPGFRDTVVDGEALRHDDVYFKDFRGKDSVAFLMYYHKSDKLFSPFMIGAPALSRKGLAFCGFEYISFKERKKFKRITGGVRPLTAYESSVCEHLFQTAQTLLH